jgi:hypothetical protein
MTTTSLEHMPNELLLLCMSFLGSIDVYRALAGLNYRFNSLLSAMIPRPLLDTSQGGCSGIRYSDMHKLLKRRHYWSRCLLSSIDTIYITDTLAGDVFYHGFHFPLTRSSVQTSSSTLFPSLRRLYITEKSIKKINVLKMFLPMVNSLRYLHLTFDNWYEFSSYSYIINTFIKYKISFYSMVFDVKCSKLFASFCIHCRSSCRMKEY